MPRTPEAAADLPALPLARAYLSGDADPVAVTDVCLSRIAEAEGSAVFIHVTAERAKREAQQSAERYSAGRPASMLDGVPFAWKDLFDLAGTTTTAGSALMRHAPPAEADAPVVANCAAAGVVSLGKVNLSEFAYSGLGLNPHFGTPANPHDPDVPRSPGGSSSGSGVAVAAGLAVASAGTDTGGSVRVPAALNGLVGYKSSEGRIPKDNVYPLSTSLDTVGPLTRTVEDCIAFDAVMRGALPTVQRADLRVMRCVVPQLFVLDDLDHPVATAFEATLSRLSAAGVTIEGAPVPELGESARVMADYGTVTAVEAYALHRDRIDGPDVAEIDGRVVARILRGKQMTAYDLLVVQQQRVQLAARLAEALDGAFLLFPTAPHVAPEIAPADADPVEFNRVNLKTLRNTMVGNFLNTPGVAIPMETDQHLPVSALISSVGGDDERVLGAALAIEAVVRG